MPESPLAKKMNARLKSGFVFPGGPARTAADFAREAALLRSARQIPPAVGLLVFSQPSPNGAFHSVLKVNLRLGL
jgi:hypothetical protein